MNLVITVAGSNSLHKLYENGDYDFKVVSYDKEVAQNLECKHFKGFKFDILKKFLKGIDLSKYEYFLFLDDDILIRPEDIEQTFKVFSEYGLQIGQPSMDSLNMPCGILHQNKKYLFHYTNWIELQAVVMSREILGRFIHLFDVNKSGWGLPNLWHSQLGFDFVVIDKIKAIHTKAYGKELDYGPFMKEYEQLIEDFKLKPENGEIKGFVYNPDITAVILYYDNDKHHLDECIKYLPIDIPIILMRTEKGGDHSTYLNVTGERIQHGVYYYEGEFNHADARNKAKAFAKTEWILTIDPDERFMPWQMETLYRDINEVPEDVWGLITYSYSAMPHYRHNGEQVATLARQCRVFRNKVNYIGEVHEAPDYEIRTKGKLLHETTLVLHHLGYEGTPKEMMKKFEKRIKGLVSNPETLEKEHWFDKLITECILYQQTKEQVNAINTNSAVSGS